MYLEIDNRGPKMAPEGTQRALTTLVFPDGIGLEEAILTAREAISYHVEGGKIAKFRSDNPDLVAALEAFYGLKPTLKPANGVTNASASLAVLMGAFIIASTRLQIRYNNGAAWQAGIMGGASNGTGAYAPATYMGISSDPTAPAAGDTTLVGEVTSGTLSRALCTYGYTGSGATTYTQSKVFTSDQTITIYKSALFTLASGGSPVFGSLLTAGGTNSPKSLFSGDQVGITETVNF